MTTTTINATTEPAAAATPTPPATGAPSKVWAALVAHPGATTAEIAAEAGVSTSTASKTLAALETERLVTRSPGSGKGRGRTPDTWTARAIETTDTEPDDEPDDGRPGHAGAEADAKAADLEQLTAKDDTAPAETASEPETGQTTNDQDADEQSSEPQQAAASEPAGAGQAPSPASEEAPAPGAEQDAPARVAETAAADGDGQPTTPKGGLRVKVAAWLADHLDRDVTPGRLGKILGHSSGAVANALDTLVRNGEAVQTGEKPYRYAHPDAKVETTDVAPRPPRPRPRPRSRHGTGAGRRRSGKAAGLTARALTAAAQRNTLDAAHPTQAGWGAYAQAAAATLAHLLGITVDQIDLASEARSKDEAWVRLSVTDPTAAPANPPATAQPDTRDEPAEVAHPGQTAPVGGGTDSLGGAGVPPSDASGAFVFTAPFGHPTRILAISACPDCTGPVPTALIGHLADLGAVITHGTAGGTRDGSDGGIGDPAPTPVPEIRDHPTHDPSCPHAAT